MQQHQVIPDAHASGMPEAAQSGEYGGYPTTGDEGSAGYQTGGEWPPLSSGGSAYGYGSPAQSRALSSHSSSGSYKGHGYWQVTPRRDYTKALSRGTVSAHEQRRSEKEQLHWQRKLDRMSYGRRSVPANIPITASAVAAASTNPMYGQSRPASLPTGLRPTYMPQPQYQQYPQYPQQQQQQQQQGYGAAQTAGPMPPAQTAVPMQMPLPQSGGAEPMRRSNTMGASEYDAMSVADTQYTMTTMNPSEFVHDDDDEEEEGTDDEEASTPRGGQEEKPTSLQSRMVQGFGTGKFVMLMAAACAAVIMAGAVFSDADLFQMFGTSGEKNSGSYGGAAASPSPSPVMYFDDSVDY